ncbi:hypothetical protein AMK59_152 [Oryctes borbonicus]|uniref:Uncharacterized protein n=1 Tax=Oryctes borbonicus TaxID=1629725 RepID=A0A0T6BDR2_9SCAR|nr:hypothetical protein AMK59_152 [Oryctes borbonicus]
MLTQTKMYLWYQKQVVDARAGPGMKSMTKFKSKHKKMCENSEKSAIAKKKHFEREYSPTLSDKSEGNHDVEMADVDFMSESGPSGRSSRTASPGGSDCEDNISVSRRHKGIAKRRDNAPQVSDFVDMDFWKKEKICCGTIFRGLNGEVLLDQRFLKPCNARLANCKLRRNECKTESDISDTSSSKVYNSDSSSDSGYDESSNQGNGGESAISSTSYKKADGAPTIEPQTSTSISEIQTEIIPKAN